MSGKEKKPIKPPQRPKPERYVTDSAPGDFVEKKPYSPPKNKK